MIERINIFQNWAGTVSAAILGVISGYFMNEIIQMREYQWFSIILLILFVIIFEKTLIFFFRRIITHSERLRKLIAENHFIEGYWIEKIVSASDAKEPYGYAFIQIQFSEMHYVVSGEIINKEKNDVISNFTSNYSDYNNYTLVYYFKGINVADNLQSYIIGRGDYEFVPNNKMPVRFRGVIMDTKNRTTLKIEAEKMNKKYVENFIDESSSELNVIALLNDYLK